MGLRESSHMLAESQRQIRTIELLEALVAEQRRTNQLLEWLGAQRGRPTDTGS
jgi:hypothetical protein